MSAFLYGGRSKIPYCARNRLRHLMKNNEIVPLCEDSRETEPHPARYTYRRSGLAMTNKDLGNTPSTLDIDCQGFTIRIETWH